jgi:hypothetical protein
MSDNEDPTEQAPSTAPIPGALTEYAKGMEDRMNALINRFELLELTMAEEHAARAKKQVLEPPPAVKSSTLAEPVLPPMAERRSIKVLTPAVNPKEPFLTLQEWDTWHDQVTNEVYKNAQGTHLAITTLMRDEANTTSFENGPLQMRQFRRVVMHKLLLKHKPKDARDDILWAAFKHHFRQCMEITADQEEKALFDIIHNKKRQLGDSIYSFASDFDTSIQQYNLICWCLVSTAQASHLLIRSLNQEHVPMLDLKFRLDAAKELGSSIDTLLDGIATFPNIALLTQIEKQMRATHLRFASQKTLLVEQDTDMAEYDIEPATQLPTQMANAVEESSMYNTAKALQCYKITKRAKSDSFVPIVMNRLVTMMRELSCAHCASTARRRTPRRPTVSVPKTTAPGQDLHVDVGHFRHPRTGPFQALVTTDKFSLFVTGGVFRGAATAEKKVELFLSSTQDSYERVTYDLGPNFRSDYFRSILERLGSQSWAVPTDAHWPSAAEKSIELLRVELDAVWAECPELSAAGSFAAAAQRLNDRALWAYNVTRRSVHLGRIPNAPRLREMLFAQVPEWQVPHMDDVDTYLAACDGKRRQHTIATARARLRTALRMRPTP